MLYVDIGTEVFLNDNVYPDTLFYLFPPMHSKSLVPSDGQLNLKHLFS